MKSHAAVRSPAYNSTPQPSFRNATAQPSFRNATAQPSFRNAATQPSFRAEQADFSASVRSCEPIGLRSEESLFSVSPCSRANVGSSGPFFSLLRALSAKSFSALFLITRNSLPTTHWFLP
jgi:hypothetical protein